MDRVRRAAAAAVGVMIVSLAGCAPASVDHEAAQDWLTAITAERDGTPGRLGAVGGMTSPTEPQTGQEGITLTLDEPGTVSKVDVLCFGGHSAVASVTTNSAASALATQTEIPCDERAHRIDVGDGAAPRQGVTSVTVSVHSSTTTTFYADVYP
ncbi:MULTISPECIES: hypothetical protein [unclassified Microbacterium]|uniref:hypothetical protein n=1 Tax=unclassified Microbacterium TaxID=2609290 RepID=UPI00386E4105